MEKNKISISKGFYGVIVGSLIWIITGFLIKNYLAVGVSFAFLCGGFLVESQKRTMIKE